MPLAFDVLRFDTHTLAISVPGACLLVIMIFIAAGWRFTEHKSTYLVQKKPEEEEAPDAARTD